MLINYLTLMPKNVAKVISDSEARKFFEKTLESAGISLSKYWTMELAGHILVHTSTDLLRSDGTLGFDTKCVDAVITGGLLVSKFTYRYTSTRKRWSFVHLDLDSGIDHLEYWRRLAKGGFLRYAGHAADFGLERDRNDVLVVPEELVGEVIIVEGDVYGFEKKKEGS